MEGQKSVNNNLEGSCHFLMKAYAGQNTESRHKKTKSLTSMEIYGDFQKLTAIYVNYCKSLWIVVSFPKLSSITGYYHV
jgi:hypothetical protein